MKTFLALFLLVFSVCFAENPFGYDLHINVIPGSNERTMICFHGYGSSYRLAMRLKRLGVVDATLVSFNFPDYNILLHQNTYNFNNIAFGTIREVLPAIFVLKKFVIDEKLDSVDLYGFSAGGGTIVNTLAVLNSDRFDEELQSIGVGTKERKSILNAIQKGIVLLDSPLKSIEEIGDLRGYSQELQMLSQIYRENRLIPMESLSNLKGLSLNVILYFEERDEVIFNRDDKLFIKRLEEANSEGNTTVIISNQGGHNAVHYPLWDAYNSKT